MEKRKCSTCFEVYPTSFYYSDMNIKDKISKRCCYCCRAYRRSLRSRPSPESIAHLEALLKPLTDFKVTFE